MTEHVEAVMGTGARIVVRSCDEAVAADACARAMTWLHRVDATFSTYRPDSEVSRIASGALAVPSASPEVREVLDRCEELRRATGGWFDAMATGALDPSGLVKGWAVERASAMLTAAGCPEHLVECGGDVRVGAGTWQVAVVHPHRLDAYCALLQLSDTAVATSGTYERGWHVFDPHRGVPATALAAVTVVGDDLGTVDAYATAALAMGACAPDWLSRLPVEWMVVGADGGGCRSEQFGALEPAEALSVQL